MAAAVAEAHRVLQRGGLLLDIHPTDEPAALEVWHARFKAAGDFTETPDNLEAVHRLPIGYLDHDAEMLGDFTAATDALAEALDDPARFILERSIVFDYRYFFDSLDELTDYLEDNLEYAHASDDLLERATIALRQATTTPKIVIVQKTAVTGLRKIE
jgi:hypothetical protein